MSPEPLLMPFPPTKNYALPVRCPYLKPLQWSSRLGTVEANPTRNHEVVGSIPGLALSVKDPVLPSAVV